MAHVETIRLIHLHLCVRSALLAFKEEIISLCSDFSAGVKHVASASLSERAQSARSHLAGDADTVKLFEVHRLRAVPASLDHLLLLPRWHVDVKILSVNLV